MKRAIKNHLVDFVAIIVLVILAAAVSGYILNKERLTWPWTSQYSLNAAFQTGQAVTPGQGQTVRVSGVQIGEHRRRHAEERRRGRADGHRSEVQPPDPHQRDRAAAPEDGPEGHVHRAQPGHVERAGRQAGLHDPGLQHEPGHQSRRDPRVARRRHALLPRPAGQRRRPGAEDKRRLGARAAARAVPADAPVSGGAEPGRRGAPAEPPAPRPLAAGAEHRALRTTRARSCS